MAFAPGRAAYVEVDGVAKKFDSWQVSLNSETADVSDYDRRSAKFVRGLPTATLSLSGPYEVGGLLMVEGQEYPVELGYTATDYVTVTALVSSIKFGTGVRGVARVEVLAVVTSDIENEDIDDPFYPNATFEEL